MENTIFLDLEHYRRKNIPITLFRNISQIVRCPNSIERVLFPTEIPGDR